MLIISEMSGFRMRFGSTFIKGTDSWFPRSSYTLSRYQQMQCYIKLVFVCIMYFPVKTFSRTGNLETSLVLADKILAFDEVCIQYGISCLIRLVQQLLTFCCTKLHVWISNFICKEDGFDSIKLTVTIGDFNSYMLFCILQFSIQSSCIKSCI